MDQVLVTYNSVDPSKLGKVLKDHDEIFRHYFYYGHPEMVVPNFNDDRPDDVYSVLSEWPCEKLDWGALEDQNGSEFDPEWTVDPDTGLITTRHFLYGLGYANGRQFKELVYRLKGYVSETEPGTGRYHFTVTELAFDY